MKPIKADDAPIHEATSCDHDNVHAGVNRRTCDRRAMRGCVGGMEERGLRDCLSTMGPGRRPGVPDAQFDLGLMNDTARSARDIAWRRSTGIAKQQISTTLSRISLGMMYANGEGVPRSDDEAAQWYRLAADQSQARQINPQLCIPKAGRPAGRCAGAHVAGHRRLGTSAFGERPAEFNRRRTPSYRIQNEHGGAR